MPIKNLRVVSPQSWRKPYKKVLVKKGRYFLSNNKKQKERKNFSKILFTFAFFAIIFLILSFFIIISFFSYGLPNPDKLMERKIAQSTKIYDRTGKNLLYEIHGDERRTLIGLNQIPDYLKYATIVTEDKDFYQHQGFDLTALIRAVIANLRKGGKTQGGSTITQQLVKNAILNPEKTYSRKIKELILSYRIEKEFTKDQILKMYFNEIPYGSQAYGAEAAAQLYFNKNAKDLTLDESTLIAALVQAPTRLSPYGSHKDELIKRQYHILDLMVEQGYISEADAEDAKKEKTLEKVVPKRENIVAPHFIMYLKELLSDKYGEKMVEQGGLKVYTTLDLDKQKIAEKIIKERVEKNKKNYKASNVSLAAIDPRSGEILVMVGSRNFFDEEIDGQFNASLGLRQPGSSFKPVAYASAFQKGYTPETILFDLETNFGPSGDGKDYIPGNYNLKTYGPVSMRQALAGSLNIPAVKTLYLAGINNVLNLAEKMGYTTLQDRSRYGLSLVLGGGEVKLLEHIVAFGIFSQNGIKYKIRAVLKIEDSQGKLIEENKLDQGERILDEQTAQEINSILSDNQARSFVFGENSALFLGDRPVAAKTGTTNDFRDAWTVGYTPSLACGVWVGNNDYTPMSKGADGSVVAAPIWHQFMVESLKNEPIEFFTTPQQIEVNKPVLKGEIGNEIKINIDKASGKIATDLTPQTFIEEKIYKEVHNILHYLNKEDPLGPAPENPYSDFQYERWEEPIKKWVDKQGYLTEKPPAEYDDLHIPENRPTAQIIFPEENKEINIDLIELKASGSAPRGIISKIDFFINQQKIDTAKHPFTILTNLNGLKNGSHSLKVIAYDDIDNAGEKEINFNLNLENRKAPIIWLAPENNTTKYSSDFPIALNISISSLKKISLVKFYYQKSSDDKKHLIATITQPENLNLSFSWLMPIDLEVENYNLFCEAIDEENNLLNSENLNININ
ncbi:MAG: 1A family penicillin-binding protein [Parcubacteria group bacterium Athens1014_10]|nr:MAG: 1A family penicillin-binding protein [Parcubacteria group bacterium Athens1014_10]TSD05112.1 MAG: 1A family penicillin-binding protein [Parcubacteria group bacterium Athens0714_12]